MWFGGELVLDTDGFPPEALLGTGRYLFKSFHLQNPLPLLFITSKRKCFRQKNMKY